MKTGEDRRNVPDLPRRAFIPQFIMDSCQYIMGYCGDQEELQKSINDTVAFFSHHYLANS